MGAEGFQVGRLCTLAFRRPLSHAAQQGKECFSRFRRKEGQVTLCQYKHIPKVTARPIPCLPTLSPASWHLHGLWALPFAYHFDRCHSNCILKFRSSHLCKVR